MDNEGENIYIRVRMKYWEKFFMTLGVGCFIGLVITPSSWLAGPVGLFTTVIGFALHIYGKGGLQ